MKYSIASAKTAIATMMIASVTAGCVGITALKPGETQLQVRAAWGAPTLVQQTATGERWTYSTAPEGNRVFLLDFDSGGRMVSQVQGLTLERVSRVKNGFTQADVEALIGPSYYSVRYPFKQEELVHTYRFQNGPFPTCFYVGYNMAGVVTSTGMADENRERTRFGFTRPC
jgi:outer membrane protein assembly factor BamE (lipoprotein component of BamABCDE complex)